MNAPEKIDFDDFISSIKTQKEEIIISAGCVADAIDKVSSTLSQKEELFLNGDNVVHVSEEGNGICIKPYTEQFMSAKIDKNFLIGKHTEKSGFVQTDVPVSFCKKMIDGSVLIEYGNINRIESLSETPIINYETGEIKRTKGYDYDTKCFVNFNGDLQLQKEITKEVARNAIEELCDDLFFEFPYENNYHRAVHLSLILTLLQKDVVKTSPLYIVNATQPGSGKSYSIDVVSKLCYNRNCLSSSYSETDEERLIKDMEMTLIDGANYYMIDNLNGSFYSSQLCSFITSEYRKIRMFGKNYGGITVKNNTTFIINGNKLTVSDDLVRRTLEIKLSPKTVSARHELKRGNPIGLIEQNRDKYLSILYTLLCGWASAGCPEHNVKVPFGTKQFSSWEKYVLSPMMWAFDGSDDWNPCLSNNDLSMEDDTNYSRDEFIRTLLMKSSWFNSSQSTSIVIDKDYPEKITFRVKNIIESSHFQSQFNFDDCEILSSIKGLGNGIVTRTNEIKEIPLMDKIKMFCDIPIAFNTKEGEITYVLSSYKKGNARHFKLERKS